MANVTISIDDDLLVRGRNFAEKRGTSLNALLRQFLEEVTTSSDAAVDEMIESLRTSGGNSGGKKIDREDLHRY